MYRPTTHRGGTGARHLLSVRVAHRGAPGAACRAPPRARGGDRGGAAGGLRHRVRIAFAGARHQLTLREHLRRCKKASHLV